MNHFILLVAVLLPATLAHTLTKRHTYGLGSCPKVEAAENFDWEKFQGQWYVIEKFSTASRCYTYNFTETEGGKKQLIQKRQMFLADAFGIDHTYTYVGSLSVPDEKNPGKMSVSFPLNWLGDADYIVFSTDYDTYAGVLTCQDLWFAHRLSATILSRKSTLDSASVKKVKTALEHYGVDTSNFNMIDHSNCHSYDEAYFNFKIDDSVFGGEDVNLEKLGDVAEDAAEAYGSWTQLGDYLGRYDPVEE